MTADAPKKTELPVLVEGAYYSDGHCSVVAATSKLELIS